MAKNEVPQGDIAAFRAFGRLWTRELGLLQESLLDSGFSLVEARLLLELGTGEGPTAAEVAAGLGLGEAYLSRVVAKLGEAGLLRKSQDPRDKRRRPLGLTASGRRALASLEKASDKAAAVRLGKLALGDRARLVGALDEASLALGGRSPARGFALHDLGPGDLGWIVQRHGEIYAQEHGFDSSFEALVAGIVAELAGRGKRKGERVWIARDGRERLGSVALVREDETTARLRLLLVEPRARGRGLGEALVGECVGFARRSGYRRIVLWTESILEGARRLYLKAGFRLVSTVEERIFGRDLHSETWELEL